MSRPISDSTLRPGRLLSTPSPTLLGGAVLGAAGIVVVFVIAASGGSLTDPDMWWHVRTGRLILETGAIPHTDPWSFTATAGSWVPTAWLSDVLFALVWQADGYAGIRVLRVALALSVVLAVWLVARRCATSLHGAAATTALVLLTLATFLRERPQVLSFLFVAWLTLQLRDVLEGHAPRLLVCVPLGWLWANVHGMWFLLPAALVGTGLLTLLDDRRRVPVAARCVTVALACWAVALATPAGPRIAIWPLVVRDVAAPINEWQPTVPLSDVGLPFLLLVGVIVASWARRDSPLPASRVAYTLALAVFGLMAFRNVAPAAILLIPELARACDRAISPLTGRQQPAGVAVPRAALLVVATGLLLAGLRLAATPTVSSSQPVRIAAALAEQQEPLRVLNHYDVGGLLTGVAAPAARVAIDGRTDMWSEAYVAQYLRDLSGAGDWRGLVDSLEPTAAVLPRDGEVARGLRLERGWRAVMDDGDWQWLEPPLGGDGS